MTSIHRVRGTGVSDHEPLPARWGRWQRIKNTVLWWVLRAVLGAAARLPLPVAYAIAFVVGTLAGALPSPPRNRARRHLAEVFTERSPRAHARITSAMFRHLARCAVEVLHQTSLLEHGDRVHVPPSVHDLLREALAGGRGAIVATAHLGNWELFAQVVAREYPTTAVAKPAYDPRITRLLHRHRTEHGLEVIWRRRQEPLATARALLRALRGGRLVAFLVDQNTRVPSVVVPFFGRPARTPSAPAAMALRRELPLLVCWMTLEGRRYVVHAVKLEAKGSIEAITARINAVLEHAIAEHPEQWVWFHQRWRGARDEEPVVQTTKY